MRRVLFAVTHHLANGHGFNEMIEAMCFDPPCRRFHEQCGIVVLICKKTRKKTGRHLRLWRQSLRHTLG